MTDARLLTVALTVAALAVGSTPFSEVPSAAGVLATLRAPPDAVGVLAPAVPSPAPSGGVGAVVPRWRWPLAPRPVVVRPFDASASPWGPGHRGLDLAAAPGDVVRAVEAGTVTHAGVVAGRGTVTVTHADGLSSTYEPVAVSVTVGSWVAVGDALGTLEAVALPHCGAGRCLHLGARRPPVYLDPLPLLTGGGRVRLLPLGGGP
ncbi:peptidoglycan DD-metalloendopeptidase family protein [Phycicoccus sp. HDW14]|uniref:murein hydrolase activator EnvC family protein n=1 Tax=Phycicoccus sp. HDW14 TaxID=2714941 RepID=UPI00140E1175|nr:M23 family metallopeptidase [Phycicoccus sp. HDW14]QIM20449.1 peptidoglycan DD-metalloendopeptidase family protein [Phycicoccus sp. HDW14]